MNTTTSDKITCAECKRQFLIIPQEKMFYTKKKLPVPSNCPECRQKRRLLQRNERKLHRRTCDKCKKNIISTYSQDSKYTVYCQECFWKEMG
ncbi:zinc-ribbon domain containing protein [Patescibacteria group bacterium]